MRAHASERETVHPLRAATVELGPHDERFPHRDALHPTDVRAPAAPREARRAGEETTTGRRSRPRPEPGRHDTLVARLERTGRAAGDPRPRRRTTRRPRLSVRSTGTGVPAGPRRAGAGRGFQPVRADCCGARPSASMEAWPASTRTARRVATTSSRSGLPVSTTTSTGCVAARRTRGPVGPCRRTPVRPAGDDASPTTGPEAVPRHHAVPPAPASATRRTSPTAPTTNSRPSVLPTHTSRERADLP